VKLKLVFIFLLCLGFSFTRAQHSVIYNSGELDISSSFEILVDTNGKSISDIPNMGLSFWSDYSSYRFPTSGNYWLRLKSPLVSVSEEYIQLITSKFDSITLYYRTDHSGWEVSENGSMYPNKLKAIPYGPISCLRLHLHQGIEYELYIKVTDVARPGFQFISKEFTLSTQEIIVSKANTARLSIYIFLGACLIMLLYNLALSFFYERRGYLTLAAFIVAIGGYTFALSGEMVVTLFENASRQNNLIVYFGSAAMFFYIPFCQIILKTKGNAPRVHRLLTILIGILAFSFVLFMLGLDGIAIPITFAVAFLVYPMVLSIAWKGRKMKALPNQYFLWANFIAIGCWVVTFMQMFGVLPDEILWLNPSMISEIGVAFMLLIFSMALGAKVNYISSELVRKELEQERFKREEEEKRNELIRGQNERLEVTVKERTAELREEKALVEEKNMEIMDSIAYAKYLQDAMLPAPSLLKSMFPNSMLFFRPKDIVSGDFYWFQEFKGCFYAAVVDCTGHGVPGAMVSVMGFNAINRCVNELGLSDPADILNRMSKIVEETFTSSDENVRDGMDMALIKFDPKTNKLEYAGAFNPLWILRSGADSIDEIRADRRPIGQYFLDKEFNTQEVLVNKGDSVFIFSDGYADQFGGKRGKKLKTVNFQKELIGNSNLAMGELSKPLHSFLEQWMGDHEQVDDICIIGIKF